MKTAQAREDHQSWEQKWKRMLRRRQLNTVREPFSACSKEGYKTVVYPFKPHSTTCMRKCANPLWCSVEELQRLAKFLDVDVRGCLEKALAPRPSAPAALPRPFPPSCPPPLSVVSHLSLLSSSCLASTSVSNSVNYHMYVIGVISVTATGVRKTYAHRRARASSSRRSRSRPKWRSSWPPAPPTPVLHSPQHCQPQKRRRTGAG